MTGGQDSGEKMLMFYGRFLQRISLLVLLFLLFVHGRDLLAVEGPVFVRGDANWTGDVDISDPIFLLGHLFNGGPAPYCPGIADANAGGEVDIADAITILTHLFAANPAVLTPLSTAEEEFCQNVPVPVEALREADFVSVQHGVQGHVEHLDDHTIRITDFYYDGTGPPEVVVWLHLTQTTQFQGWAISPDLRRAEPYVGETLTFPIPGEITGDMFGYVSIWCTDVPTNYGHAQLEREFP